MRDEFVRVAEATANAVERLLGARSGSFVSPACAALAKWQATSATKKTRARH